MNTVIQDLPGVEKTFIVGGLKSFQVSLNEFEQTIDQLKSDYSDIWLFDIIAIDKIQTKNKFEIRYLFCLIEQNQNFFVVVEANEEEIPSVSKHWKNAYSLENEIRELFGIKFSSEFIPIYFGIENKVYPMCKNSNKSPTPKNIEFENIKFNVESPLDYNQILFDIKLENDVISQLNVMRGTYHIGLEKVFEQMSLKEMYSVIENYFPINGGTWSQLISMNAEDEIGIEIPERAQALRMIIIEFNRVMSHLMYLREMSLFLENNKFLYELNIWIKKLQALYISYCGNEYFLNIIRLGGVVKDVPQVWLSRAMDEVEKLQKSILKFYKFIQHSNSWKDVLDIKLLNKEDPLLQGVTGPLVRTLGINLDFRKHSPFYFYSDVDFDIPIGAKGTVFDLFCIKMEEIFQSFKIIVQVLDNLPTGHFISKDVLDLNLNEVTHSLDEDKYKSQVQSLFTVNHLDRTKYIEGNNGIMGLTKIFNDQKSTRFKMMTNDTFLVPLFENLMQGRDLNQAELIWKALDVNMKLLER